MAAILTYEDGLSILKSALFKTRGHLNQPTLFLYIVHAYYEGWLEKGAKFDKFFAVAIFMPVAPDDFLCYLAGLTKMRSSRFLKIIILGKPFAIAA